jgi:ribosomal protein S12 methylthiotransferase
LKTKHQKKHKVNIVTFGCSKNLVDSEVLLTQLRANEIDATHEAKKNDARVVVINTCGFIENAKEESINAILQYAQLKEAGKVEKVYVTGCLSQRYRDELEAEIPNVDGWFGTSELPKLLKRLGADYKHELIGERLLTTSSHYAYMKISEGCDRPCSFCAIPLMRGKHVSKPIDLLVEESQRLAAKGVKELILIAQELTYYGIDIYRKRALAELLEKLAQTEGIDWIRLHYAYPTNFPLEVLDVMAQSPKICKYLDIPLQSASNRILKLMRRGITREKTEELIENIKLKVPGLALRTTLITGHPQETEDDHEETLRFVEKMSFDRLGVFTYSHEEQTHAFEKYQDDVPDEVKQRRMKEIMALQQKISLAKNETKIGKTFKTLFDRKEGGYFVGRTEHDSPEVDNEVLVDAKKHFVRVGDFAEIKIFDATEFDLYGEPV